MRGHILGLILALCLQYALGMYANLFVTFPHTDDIHTRWVFAMDTPLLAAHVVLGTLLLIGAIVLVIRTKSSKIRLPAYFGLLGVVLAWLGGERFISTQNNFFSYIMSLSFLLTLLAYYFAFTHIKNIQER